MRNIPTMQDGLTSLSAEEFNDIPDEMENAIVSSGQSLNPGDKEQQGKAMANYANCTEIYTDSGTADNYVLAPVGSFKQPSVHQEGLTVTFKPNSSNTGGGTKAYCNLAGYPAIEIVNDDLDTALAEKQLTPTQYTTLTLIDQNGGLKWRVRPAMFDNNVATYGVAGDYFFTGGTGNAIELTASSSRTQPRQYFDGMRVRFQATGTNIGGSVTCNIGDLGAKDVHRDTTGADLLTADIVSGDFVELVYDLGTDAFLIVDNNNRKTYQGDGGDYVKVDNNSIDIKSNSDSNQIVLQKSSVSIEMNNSSLNAQASYGANAAQLRDSAKDINMELKGGGVRFYGPSDPASDTNVLYRIAKIDLSDIASSTAIANDNGLTSEDLGGVLHTHKSGYAITGNTGAGDTIDLLIPSGADILGGDLRYERTGFVGVIDIAPVTFHNLTTSGGTWKCEYITISTPVAVGEEDESWTQKQPDLTSDDTYLIIRYDAQGV